MYWIEYRKKRGYPELKCDLGFYLMHMILATVLDGLWNNIDIVQSSGGIQNLNPFNITLHLHMHLHIHTCHTYDRPIPLSHELLIRWKSTPWFY